MSGEHTVELLCEALLVSRSGYYDWRRRRLQPRPRQQENAKLREQIKEVFARSRGTYGSPRITRCLGRPGSENRIARLMRLEHIYARQRSKYRVRTTDSKHADAVAPNRLLGVIAKRRDEVWVSDITYIVTGEGWLFLAAVLDLYTRRVVGWAMSDQLDTKLTLSALQMAIAQRRPNQPLIVHSDRGRQYASTAYQQLLRSHGFMASMSRKANCYDNAHIESFWSSLKYELMYRTRFATRAEARTAVFDYIERFYNRQRLHSSLGYKSPLDFESARN